MPPKTKNDCQNPNAGSAEQLPRLAMINDIAGFGRCSTTVALPVISAMQVQVCPVPTSILSNHLAFPHCYFEDYTPHMREYLHAWEQLGITFDGLYCGFLGNVEQIAIVEEFLNCFQPGIFLLDPVMGDHGKAYSTVTRDHCLSMKRLLKYAQIITPNITEACLLTDTPYHEGAFSLTELEAICEKLSRLCSGSIVITGLHNHGSFANYIRQDNAYHIYETPSAGASRPGTGDLFASVLIADALLGRELTASVKKAADFIAACISSSDKAGIPVKEGVLFEKYLHLLISQ